VWTASADTASTHHALRSPHLLNQSGKYVPCVVYGTFLQELFAPLNKLLQAPEPIRQACTECIECTVKIQKLRLFPCAVTTSRVKAKKLFWELCQKSRNCFPWALLFWLPFASWKSNRVGLCRVFGSFLAILSKKNHTAISISHCYDQKR
jgi:hypothetical protein